MYVYNILYYIPLYTHLFEYTSLTSHKSYALQTHLVVQHLSIVHLLGYNPEQTGCIPCRMLAVHAATFQKLIERIWSLTATRGYRPPKHC